MSHKKKKKHNVRKFVFLGLFLFGIILIVRATASLHSNIYVQKPSDEFVQFNLDVELTNESEGFTLFYPSGSSIVSTSEGIVVEVPELEGSIIATRSGNFVRVTAKPRTDSERQVRQLSELAKRIQEKADVFDPELVEREEIRERFR